MSPEIQPPEYDVDNTQPGGFHRYGVIGVFVILAVFGIVLFAILTHSQKRSTVITTPSGERVVVTPDSMYVEPKR